MSTCRYLQLAEMNSIHPLRLITQPFLKTFLLNSVLQKVSSGVGSYFSLWINSFQRNHLHQRTGCWKESNTAASNLARGSSRKPKLFIFYSSIPHCPHWGFFFYSGGTNAGRIVPGNITWHKLNSGLIMYKGSPATEKNPKKPLIIWFAD